MYGIYVFVEAHSISDWNINFSRVQYVLFVQNSSCSAEGGNITEALALDVQGANSIVEVFRLSTSNRAESIVFYYMNKYCSLLNHVP
jgi:hypothetical protein